MKRNYLVTDMDTGACVWFEELEQAQKAVYMLQCSMQFEKTICIYERYRNNLTLVWHS